MFLQAVLHLAINDKQRQPRTNLQDKASLTLFPTTTMGICGIILSFSPLAAMICSWKAVTDWELQLSVIE